MTDFLKKLDTYYKKNYINKKYTDILKDFYISYKQSQKTDKSFLKLFDIFLELVKDQIKTPYQFECFHKKILKPFDYNKFGIDFLKPLIDIKNSNLLGIENLKKIRNQLKKNENIILLSNHQTESDPQAISCLLEKDFFDISDNIIYVAGERVVKDPIAAPISMGCNLLCIYSKKHINHPIEKKEEKQLHNKKAMNILKYLLQEGGKIIYIAPSGGRDRKNQKNEIEIAPFDYKSIQMLLLISKNSNTHFYPLSLHTYEILPPPSTTDIEMGEKRVVQKGKIHAFFGEEINMNSLSDYTKKKRCLYIYDIVKKNYKKIKNL